MNKREIKTNPSNFKERKLQKRGASKFMKLNKEETEIIMQYQKQFPELLQDVDRFVVDSRVLWKQLGEPQGEYRKWVKRKIEDKGFIEDVDYIRFSKTEKSDCKGYGNKTTKEYFLTLDCTIEVLNKHEHISDVGIKILDYLLTLNDRKYKVFISDKRKEVCFLDLLEDCLNVFGINDVIRQYRVLDKYRIDMYIKELNIAIEYDENNHASYTYKQHEGRQMEIENLLGCKFIRVSDVDADGYNVGLIVKEIMGCVAA